MNKLIVTAAVTGTISPSQSPYVPLTSEAIAEEAYAAWQAGASIIHIHAREPVSGKPSSELDHYVQIISRIKQKCDAIICVTTGGGVGMTIQERTKVIPIVKPEMASFTTGSMNFGLFPAAEKIQEFKYDWEKPYLESTRDFIFKNTFADQEYIARVMAENQTKPEVEIFDVGQLYSAAWLVKKGFLKLPVHLQFVMGVLGGIGATPEDLLHLYHQANRLFDKQFTWSVIGIGYPGEFVMATQSILLGGNVRVGFEDNIFIKKGVLAKSNSELVHKVRRIAGEFDREIATPAETRRILGLKGAESIAV